MIELVLGRHCQNCSNFEAAETDMISTSEGPLYVIKCKNEKLCKTLLEYFEKYNSFDGLKGSKRDA